MCVKCALAYGGNPQAQVGQAPPRPGPSALQMSHAHVQQAAAAACVLRLYSARAILLITQQSQILLPSNSFSNSITIRSFRTSS
jgi:hypothetical protein